MIVEEGSNMIYPSHYLMNLLWVAKLFMSLITKFLHASIPWLASGPKSNSARQNTRTRAYTPFFFTLPSTKPREFYTEVRPYTQAGGLAYVWAGTQIHI